MSGLNVTMSIKRNAKASGNSFPTLNPKFTEDLTTVCPCCKQVSLETAFQEPLIAGKSGYTLTHCKNPECTGYALTLERTAFMAKMETSNE